MNSSTSCLDYQYQPFRYHNIPGAVVLLHGVMIDTNELNNSNTFHKKKEHAIAPNEVNPTSSTVLTLALT